MSVTPTPPAAVSDSTTCVVTPMFGRCCCLITLIAPVVALARYAAVTFVVIGITVIENPICGTSSPLHSRRNCLMSGATSAAVRVNVAAFTAAARSCAPHLVSSPHAPWNEYLTPRYTVCPCFAAVCPSTPSSPGSSPLAGTGVRSAFTIFPCPSSAHTAIVFIPSPSDAQ